MVRGEGFRGTWDLRSQKILPPFRTVTGRVATERFSAQLPCVRRRAPTGADQSSEDLNKGVPYYTSPFTPPIELRPTRNELWTRPDDGAARAQAPGCQRCSCRSVRRGRGGGQEGIGIASDVMKVKVEDPDTPGSLKGGQGKEVRQCFSLVCVCPSARWKPRDHNDFPTSA